MGRRPIAVILAAGEGKRLGEGMPKAFVALLGRPLLAWAVEGILRAARPDRVVAAVPAGRMDAASDLLAPFNPAPVLVAGGATRMESLAACLEAVAGESEAVVLVHDAARPIVDRAMVERVLAAMEDPAADAAVPVLTPVETVKWVHDDRSEVAFTIDRTRVRMAGTPQASRLAVLGEAVRAAASEGFDAPDEASLVERRGGRVVYVEGARDNVKVTEPGDLVVAEALLLGTAGPERTAPRLRAGLGMDCHPIAPGGPLRLGCVEIPCDFHLAGHSDGDAAAHAIADAALSAAGAGDLGTRFPAGDRTTRGIGGSQVLAGVASAVAEKGARVAGVDCSIVCDSPPLGPYSGAMADAVASSLGVARPLVSIKPRHAEGLGFAGRGEGILALAVVLIER